MVCFLFLKKTFTLKKDFYSLERTGLNRLFQEEGMV